MDWSFANGYFLCPICFCLVAPKLRRLYWFGNYDVTIRTNWPIVSGRRRYEDGPFPACSRLAALVVKRVLKGHDRALKTGSVLGQRCRVAV